MLKIYKVFDQSMEPCLHNGDYVLASRLHGRLRKGDIVIVRHPIKRMTLVKRISSIDGNTIFVTGDNIAFSEDSRSFGPVSGAAVLGKVIAKA